MDIFEQLDKDFDLYNQVRGLNDLVFFDKLCSLNGTTYSLFTVFGSTIFKSWKYNYGCNDIKELLDKLGLFDTENDTIIYVDTEKEAHSFLQLDVNILYHCFSSRYEMGTYGVRIGNALWDCAKHKIDFILNKACLQVKKHPTNNYYLVVPKDEKVILAADTTDPETAFHLYEYTSLLVKDDVNKKRDILKLLCNKYEAIIKEYLDRHSKAPFSCMFDDLSYILNSFELRHPNLNPKSQYYKENLIKYTQEQWIEIYDVAFQLILNATFIDNYCNQLSNIVSKHKQKIEKSKNSRE